MDTQVHVLDQQNSIFNQFIAEIRDEQVQKDKLRFRYNLERIGNVMAYEISKTLNYSHQEIVTPLGVAEMQTLNDFPVISTILRAGIPMQNGFLQYFDKSDSCFISAYRNHKNGEDEYDIEVEYMSGPSLTDKVLIIVDTMLATGSSILAVYKALKGYGKPRAVHIASAIGSKEGLLFLQKHLPQNTTYWFGALDEELTARAYIIPGLGDAGDLAYGPKIKPQ